MSLKICQLCTMNLKYLDVKELLLLVALKTKQCLKKTSMQVHYQVMENLEYYFCHTTNYHGSVFYHTL